MVGRVVSFWVPAFFLGGKLAVRFRQGNHFSPSPGVILLPVVISGWDLEDLKACQSWKSFSPMLDWVTVREAQPKLRDGSGFSGWFLVGLEWLWKETFCLKRTIWKWKMEYVPGNSASLFAFWGWLNDPFKGCFYVTNPTFGDQVRSPRLNHLVSKFFFFFRIVGSSKRAYSGGPKWWLWTFHKSFWANHGLNAGGSPPLGTMMFFFNQGILGIPRQNVERNHSVFFRNSWEFFRNLLKKILDHKTRFSFHFVLYPMDLGPSNGRVWTCIPGVFWSEK